MRKPVLKEMSRMSSIVSAPLGSAAQDHAGDCFAGPGPLADADEVQNCVGRLEVLAYTETILSEHPFLSCSRVIFGA